MDEDHGKEMQHEDNSFATKFAVLFSIALLLGVLMGCVWIVWEVIKFFIY